MPLISKCQLPFKLRPRCITHVANYATHTKKTKNTPSKRALGPFIHSYQVPFSVTGRPWFVPGFLSLFQDALYLLRHSPSSNPNTLFPASFSLHQHSSCLCEEDLFRNNGGSSAPNIKELTKKKITLWGSRAHFKFRFYWNAWLNTNCQHKGAGYKAIYEVN